MKKKNFGDALAFSDWDRTENIEQTIDWKENIDSLKSLTHAPGFVNLRSKFP